MKLRGRIPVEPLSDERMTAIERRIVSGAAESAPPSTASVGGRWFPVIAAAFAIVVAGGLGWKFGTARVDALRPAEVEVARSIRVDTMERTTLALGDATITSDPRTQLVITRPGGGVLVDMARGKVELEVAKRAERPPLVVRAGETDVIVVGTHFTVDYGDGTGTAIVEVMEGVVQVVRHDAPTVRVAAGEGFTAKRGMITAAELHAELAAEAATTPATPAATLEDRRGTHATGPRATKKFTQYQEDFHAALRARAITPADDVQESDPDKAILLHYKTASGRGADASRALYSVAVVQLLQLRDPVKALATLDAYMNRFAHKNEHADALWLRVRILCERTFDERCRHAAEVYVREVPEGTKTGLAEKISVTVE